MRTYRGLDCVAGDNTWAQSQDVSQSCVYHLRLFVMLDEPQPRPCKDSHLDSGGGKLGHQGIRCCDHEAICQNVQFAKGFEHLSTSPAGISDDGAQGFAATP